MALAPAEANLAVIKGKPRLSRVVERLVVAVAVAVVAVGALLWRLTLQNLLRCRVYPGLYRRIISHHQVR
jgi:hypothetical protein